MEISYVVFYAILNILVFICLLRKYALFSPGMIVLAFYVMVALFAIPAYGMLPYDNYFCIYNFTEIRVWPYICYLALTLILIKPILNYDHLLGNTNIVLHAQKTKIFILVFIVCSLASILIYGRMLISHSILDNFEEIRQDLYEGVLITAYNNQLEHFVLLFTHYFSLPAQILFFYVLTDDSKETKLPGTLIVLLGIGIVLPEIMDAARTASRGMIINVFFKLMLCYCLFRSYIPQKKKMVLLISFILSVLLMAVYSLMVTDARFGQAGDEGSFSSLICYFGQPTLVFNSQVSQIDTYAWGARFFYPVFELFGAQPDIILSSVSKGWGVCFSTLVGDIWQDIGIFTVFAIPVIVVGFSRWIQNRESYGIAELYIMAFYATTIQRGVLVTGYGMCVQIAISVLMYFLLKFYLSETTEEQWPN